VTARRLEKRSAIATPLNYRGNNNKARPSRDLATEFTPRNCTDDFKAEVVTFTDGGATAVTGCFVTDPQLGEIADVA